MYNKSIEKYSDANNIEPSLNFPQDKSHNLIDIDNYQSLNLNSSQYPADGQFY